MEWALEVVLILLLMATLFHAMRLERALGVLKRDRATLEELVASFNNATIQAEKGVQRLREAADGAGRDVAQQAARAQTLKDDLAFLIERGEKLADRLDHLVRSTRNLPPMDLRQKPLGPRLAPAAEAPRGEAETTNGDLTPAGAAASRVRSQAERDLLQALKAVR